MSDSQPQPLLPSISDRMLHQDLIELAGRPGAESVYLEGMSTEYRISCYLLGTGMIVTAVVASLARGARVGRRSNVADGYERRFTETVVMPPEARETATAV